jgi:hypothetical protein
VPENESWEEEEMAARMLWSLLRYAAQEFKRRQNEIIETGMAWSLVDVRVCDACHM